MRGAVDLCGCAGSAGPQDGRPAVPLPPTAQDDEEGTAEGLVEEGVEDGVQHGVDVAQPQAGCPQLVRHCVVYEGVNYVGDEERRPAEAETPHDDAQRLGCFSFCSHTVVSLMVSRVRRTSTGPRVGTRSTRCAATGSSSPLQHADLPGVCTGRDVDPLVGQHHEDQRDVEGHHRAGEGIWLVDHEDTGCGVAAFAVAPLLDLVKTDTSRKRVQQGTQVKLRFDLLI